MNTQYISYPAPLVSGSRIAITAFSSGVDTAMHPRLDRVIADLEARGFEIVQGQCLRNNENFVSADKFSRANELMHFLLDDSIDAVIPPWGGELAIELLPLLDYMQIMSAKPKWILGYSDVSTLASAITTLCGWATAHTANLMELISSQPDELTANTFEYMSTAHGMHFCQSSSEKFQKTYIDFEKHPDSVFNLTEKTEWKPLNFDHFKTRFSGRLIGGCLDTLMHLFNTPYLNLEAFKHQFQDSGVILYLENVQMTPTELHRALLGLQYQGIFEDLNGLLIGRNYASHLHNKEYKSCSYSQILLEGIGDVNYPVLMDVDIGHQPPNLTLINGALSEIDYLKGKGTITQWLN